MNQYSYVGPVLKYGKVISDDWSATTWARSLKKAKSNLEFRFKKIHGLVPNAKIELPGELTLVEGGDDNE